MRDKLIPKNIGDWADLAYWRTGEWQTVKEKLDEDEYNPGPSLLFAALRHCPLRSCTCAILGQDPYPKRDQCAGIAFATPADYAGATPASLKNIFRELEGDLGIPTPQHGDLSRWCEQGVLLWNVYPSCSPGKPGSHHWDEWDYLTEEIIKKLDAKESPIVFVSLGNVAHRFGKSVVNGRHIATSHPSPLGYTRGFRGSKLFSKINLSLRSLGHPEIDWRL